MNLLSYIDIEAAYSAAGEDLYGAIRLLAWWLRVNFQPDIVLEMGNTLREIWLYCISNKKVWGSSISCGGF